MGPDTMLRSFISCNNDPNDFLAWETFLKELQREGHEGPLIDFVQDYVRIQIIRKRILNKSYFIINAWEPLVSQGIVLFTKRGHSTRTVLHIGMQGFPGGDDVKNIYPEGWQRSFLTGLCGASPGWSIPSREFEWVWTKRSKPFSGVEYPPCKACLLRLRGISMNGFKELTSKQIDKIWKIRGESEPKTVSR